MYQEHDAERSNVARVDCQICQGTTSHIIIEVFGHKRYAILTKVVCSVPRVLTLELSPEPTPSDF